MFRWTTTAAAGLTLAAIAATAVAAPRPRPPRRAVVNTPRKRRADRNRDGVVGPRERHQAAERRKELSKVDTPREAAADRNKDGKVGPREHRAFVHKSMDKNNDGRVDLKERAGYWSAAKSGVNTPLEKKYDADGDGWLTGDEAREFMRDRLRLIRTDGRAKVSNPLERRFDADGDGIIDRDEAEAIRHALYDLSQVDKRWEALADRNKDGRVDRTEAGAFWLRRRAKVNTPIEKKYDTDGDGWLTGDEARQFMEDRLRLAHTHGRAKVDSPLEREFDADGDGIISHEEAEVLREAIEQRRMVDTAWEEKVDRNDDGVVDRKEIRTSRFLHTRPSDAKPEE